MDIVMFFQIVAAVFVGGMMVAGFLWGLMTAERLERGGTPQHKLPFRVYFLIIAPLAICAAVVLYIPVY